MSPKSYTLTTFIKPDPEDAAFPDRYVAGFQETDGSNWGLTVPLDGSEVRRAVHPEQRKWRVALYDMEGILHPAPDALEIGDEEYGSMLQSGALERIAIDKLISDAIELQDEDTNNDNLADLKKLLHRLERCMTMVDDEIARRERLGGGSRS